MGFLAERGVLEPGAPRPRTAGRRKAPGSSRDAGLRRSGRSQACTARTGDGDACERARAGRAPWIGATGRAGRRGTEASRAPFREAGPLPGVEKPSLARERACAEDGSLLTILAPIDERSCQKARPETKAAEAQPTELPPSTMRREQALQAGNRQSTTSSTTSRKRISHVACLGRARERAYGHPARPQTE